MTTWKDGYVEANGIRIHYYRTGGDKPQVVLNHGVMDDGLCWTRVAKELERDYDVVMFDSRGHGLSDSTQSDYASETRAKDIAEAIQQLGLSKPVIGGHSMGADTSLHIAALYPDLPRAIFMEDPPITMPNQSVFGGKMGENEAKLFKIMMLMMLLFKILPKFIGKVVARKIMPDCPDTEIIPWLNSKKRLSMNVIVGMRTASESMIGASFETFKLVQVPALLIMGDREKGAIVSEEAAMEMKKSLPGLQIVHLHGANHDIRRMKFDEYIQALRDFLAEVYG